MPSFSTRTFNFLGFLFCCAVLLLAYYLQYAIGLQPCPLCVFQRLFFIALSLLFLLATLQNPNSFGVRIYAGLSLLISSLGFFTAARHLWLQLNPPAGYHACFPDIHYLWNSLSFLKVLEFLFMGTGDCAKVEWRFLGFSIAAWSLIGFSLLILFSLLQFKRTE